MTMVILGSPNSPYLRKTRIVAAEKGIEVEFRQNSPWTRETLSTAYNPLGKIPVLILDDGSTLFDSRVIVQYLDQLVPAPALIPHSASARIDVLRWEALADGICDAVQAYFLDLQYPEDQRRPAWTQRQRNKILPAMQAVARDLGHRSWCVGDSLTVADAALICALDYLSFRAPEVLDWRAEYADLSSWADRIGERPSVGMSAPPKRGEAVFEGQTFDPTVS